MSSRHMYNTLNSASLFFKSFSCIYMASGKIRGNACYLRQGHKLFVQRSMKENPAKKHAPIFPPCKQGFMDTAFRSSASEIPTFLVCDSTNRQWKTKTTYVAVSENKKGEKSKTCVTIFKLIFISDIPGKIPLKRRRCPLPKYFMCPMKGWNDQK